MKIVVDGCSSTGRTTLATSLRELGFDVDDGGLPTYMADNSRLKAPNNEFYVILSIPVGFLTWRLGYLKKDMTERCNSSDSLVHYHRRFLEVAKVLPHHVVISTMGTEDQTLAKCLTALAAAGVTPTRPSASDTAHQR
jgi:hypothetical protein